MNKRMIQSAESAYRNFENKAAVIAADVTARLEGFQCEVSCDMYKDGLCVCFENLEAYIKNEYRNILDSFVVPVKDIPKRRKIDIDFVLKNSI